MFGWVSGGWICVACANVKLGDGAHCLLNTFDKPSVWKYSSPTSLSFFSLRFSLVPEDMTEGVWNLSLSVGSPQGWLCLDHATALVVESLLVISVVCEVIITQAGHPMASSQTTTAWVINEGPFS